MFNNPHECSARWSTLKHKLIIETFIASQFWMSAMWGHYIDVKDKRKQKKPYCVLVSNIKAKKESSPIERRLENSI